jgi:hypothetical protein
VGAGLTPVDVISVESIGIPAGPTDPPALIPRGEVVPSEGIAVSGSSTSTWPNAGPAHNKDQAVTAISNGLVPDTPIRAVGFATISRGAKLSDIGQSQATSVSMLAVKRSGWLARRIRATELPIPFGRVSSGRCPISCPAPRPASPVLCRMSKASLAPLRSLEISAESEWPERRSRTAVTSSDSPKVDNGRPFVLAQLNTHLLFWPRFNRAWPWFHLRAVECGFLNSSSIRSEGIRLVPFACYKVKRKFSWTGRARSRSRSMIYDEKHLSNRNVSLGEILAALWSAP